MGRSWRDDKRWSDRFLTEIKSILGVHLIGEPPIEEDQERNTDLIVLKMEPVRVGCRVRRPGYLEKYGNEFTIREGRPSGFTTEMTKIIQGWGDYFFYGHSDSAERSLARWLLIDLKVFREHFFRTVASLPAGKFPGTRKGNGDMSSWFRAFNIHDFPPEILVAEKAEAEAGALF